MSDPLERALSFLPHGPEFRFVDRLTKLEGGQRGSGEYRMRGTEDFLRGHFPGQPLMPGVLLVEAGAQLAGVVAQNDPNRKPLLNLKLTAIRNVKILRSVVPGEVIQLEAQISGRLAGLVQARISASASGHELMEGEITLAGDLDATG